MRSPVWYNFRQTYSTYSDMSNYDEEKKRRGAYCCASESKGTGRVVLEVVDVHVGHTDVMCESSKN